MQPFYCPHHLWRSSVSTPAAVLLLTTILLVFSAEARAEHAKGEEVNVVLISCVIDTTRKPLGFYVEAISSNTTQAPQPLIRPGEQCAQALHEYMTAGFELVNKLTATDQFLLTRKDKAVVQH